MFSLKKKSAVIKEVYKYVLKYFAAKDRKLKL